MRVFYSLDWRDAPFIFAPPPWPPLQFYLYGLGLIIYPDPIYTPLLINILFGGLLAVVIGHLVRDLSGDTEAGLIAGLIAALYPLAIRYSLIAVPEVILNFLIFLTLCLLLRARVSEPGRLQIGYVVTAAITMSAAEWTHLPAWYMMPLFSLLLWGRWRQWIVFVVIAALPIALFAFHLRGIYGGWIPPNWLTASFSGNANPDSIVTLVHQLFYYPALLIQTLSPALVLLALVGLLHIVQHKPDNWKLQLFPLLCLTALIPAYLLFVFAWDRTKPKEALLLSLLMIPYAAIGSVQLKPLIKGRLLQWVVVATALAMLIVAPYNWKFGERGGIFPIPKTAPEYRQLATWLNENLEPDDSIVFDHLPLWSDFYLALATRRMPNQVFLTLDTFSPTILPRLIKFVAEQHPKFLVLSKQPATVSAVLELSRNCTGCPEIAWEPTLQVELSKRLETEHVCIYGMSE